MTYRQLVDRIEAVRRDHRPRTTSVGGRWVGLAQEDLLPPLLALWQESLSGPDRSIDRGRPRGATARASAGGGLFLSGWEWYGGTPGDARRGVFDLLFEDGVLLRTDTVDSCTQRSMEIEVHAPPGVDPARREAAVERILLDLART